MGKGGDSGQASGRFRASRVFVFRSERCENGEKSAYKEECALLPDCVNVVLELDMPLVKLKDVTSLADRMKRDKINCVRLGSKDALSKICIGKDTSGGVFSSSQAFLRLMMQNRSIWCIIGLKTKYLTKCFRAE